MKQSVIGKLAEEDVVGKIIRNIAKNSADPDLKDLEQDIYLQLMEKDEEMIENLYENGQLNYYITKIAINNIKSKTSRFYYTYKKNKAKNITLDEWNEKAD